MTNIWKMPKIGISGFFRPAAVNIKFQWLILMLNMILTLIYIFWNISLNN